MDGAREKEKSENAGWTLTMSWHTEALTILKNMVHPGGFEPPTARFVAEYSIQLSYGCIENGGEGGIRTLDTAFDRILP